MIHNVVYHADLDGIVSAALYLKFKINKPSGYRLYPMMSYQRGEKFNSFITSLHIPEGDELAIFDFENHGASTFWVDHHPCKALGFSAVTNDEAVYDPSSYSAAALVFNYLKTIATIPDNVADLVKQINMIDSAMYPDVNYIFNDVSPIMIIRAYLERTIPNDMIFNHIVETLCATNFDANETLAMLNLDSGVVSDLRNDVGKAKQYMEVYNKISLIRQRRVSQFPRYSEQFLRSDVKYNVRVSSVGNKRLHLQVMFNRWHLEKNDLHIGRFLSNLEYVKGGGHYNVGGGFIREDNVEQFIDDLSNITHNWDEDTMEKYGVDTSDPFEKKADELVKTGESNNIEDAREQVQKETESNGTAEPIKTESGAV